MRARRRFNLSSADGALRRELPYGVWTTAGGGQILFNRDYSPIWQRSANAAAIRIAAWRWVDWAQQNYFFDDDNAPFHDGATKKICARIVADFIAGKPIDQYWRAHETRRRQHREQIKMNPDNQFHHLAEEAAREEFEKISRLIEAGYLDLAEQVLDGEIDVQTAMQIFGGRRRP
jgi:hypothetical protein